MRVTYTHISSIQFKESMHWELISICSPLGSAKLNVVSWSRRAYGCVRPLAPYETILQVVEDWDGTPSHFCRVLSTIRFMPPGREASCRHTSTRLFAATLSVYVKAWRLTWMTQWAAMTTNQKVARFEKVMCSY